MSADKTVSTPRAPGFDFLGQPLRHHAGRKGKPAKLLSNPSRASFPALKATVRPLCKQAAGATPAARSDRLHPVLRGGAHSHRSPLCRQPVSRLDSCVLRGERSRAAPDLPGGLSKARGKV